ncbi:MAG: FtsW/RodA/SpoVE family cell cycle protein [Bacteroidales bacterium]|nr:FtsW/RodA/SpoVE family cell cycle protein [Bacteroidales bacterium]
MAETEKKKKKRKERDIWNWMEGFKGDKVILIIALLLMLISVISVFSSTPLLAIEKGIDRISIMTSQLKVVGLGVVVILLFYVFGRSKGYRILGKYCFAASLAMLLILVLNLDLGVVQAGEINGARRIIKVFGKQLHVYEFVKVFMVLYLAWALDAYKKGNFRLSKRLAERFPRLGFLARPFWEKVMYIYVPIAVTTFCIMMGSNSSALFIAGVMVLIILVGGIDAKDIVWMAVVLVAGIGLVYGAYKAGLIEGRIATAISRVTNDDEATMQVLLEARPGSREYNEARDELKQPVGALLAIKEGGIFGKGIGGSTQKYTVPVIFGDYMFSFIIEETGILGGILLILLLFSLLARGTMIAKDCDEYFDKIVVVGLTILVTGQAFMHMAVNVHMPLVPQTGQTLPLVSHGTTSFLVFSAVFGILLSISRQAWLKMRRREEEALPIIEHHDEVQEGLSDLDILETENLTEEE